MPTSVSNFFICRVCSINYQITGQTELDITQQILPIFNHKITARNKVTSRDLQKSIMRERLNEKEFQFFYKGLPKSVARKLYTMYRADFVLFDFVIEDDVWGGFVDW